MRAGFACLAALSGPAPRAQELDTVLPDGIPGYGTPFAVVSPTQARHAPPTGYEWSGATIAPSLNAAQGYDSAPNGGGASFITSASPNLLIADKLLGFGSFAALNAAIYPQDKAQNTNGAVLAAGEQAQLPREKITVSAAYLRAQETGFALDSLAISRPINFTLHDLRASDEISIGEFTLKPAISTTTDHFADLPEQNRTDNRETLTATYIPGGPVTLLLRVQGTQSNYSTGLLNAETNQVLAGMQDTISGLWTFSALAGVAQRLPSTGPQFSAPVLEARLDWMPTELDRVRLTLAREIDDPDEIAATPYTLTEENISFEQQYMENTVLKLTARASNAIYLHSSLRETLYYGEANLAWQFAPSIALTGDYTFNDRQANYLRAANEHIVTFGFTWTP